VKRFKQKLSDSLDVLSVYQEVSFENSIVSVTDQSGTILLANDNFCRISGYSEEELVGSNHRIVNSGYHSNEFFSEMWGQLLKGKKWQGEICNRAKDGSIYWVDTTITPVWNEEKSGYEFISIRLEVTHRKRFEEVLARIEDVGHIGYWEWHIEKNTLFWSDMVYQIHGLSREEFSPTVETSIENFCPEYRDTLAAFLERALETGEGYDMELEVFHKDGHRVWTRAVGQAEFVGGKAFRVYGTFQDIDKRKRMHMDYAKSQVQLQLAVESAGIGNWVYNPYQDKLTWDDASFDIFGVKKENFGGKIQNWIDTLVPESREESFQNFSRCIENKEEIYNNEFEIDHPTRGRRTIKGRAFITYNHLGDPNEIVGLNWDITEEKEAQNILIEAREKAINATQAKSAFLASMSHEIRTPMNGLMGTLELLSETELSAEQRELLETVQMSGEQLLNVVNDILDFSKIEAGKMELEFRNLDLQRLLKGVKSIFEVQANKKGIKLFFEMAKDVPRYIKGDETRLKQILSNLVSNAIKFTSIGSISILVESKGKPDSQEDLRTLVFKVVDSGIGIPLKKQKSLFDSFTQVDATTTRRYGGTGLGLAICKSLVNSMGGQIGVESSHGKGSTFFFEIMTSVGEQQSKKNETSGQHALYRKDIKILLAEDNKTNQKLALSFLKKLGFGTEDIHVAHNGLEAYEKVEKHLRESRPFDLVLMDMQMPEMDGVESTKKIISKWGEKAPIIVAMTANVFEEDRKKCLEAGMKDFVTKPIKKTTLIEILNEHFSDHTLKEIYMNSEPIMSQTNYQYLDTEKLLYEFGDDFDIFQELVEDFTEQVPEFTETIKEALKSKDAKAIQVAGHTLKGIVGNFYCKKLKEAAYDLEIAGKEENFAIVEEKLGVFLSLNEIVSQELETLIKEKTDSSQAA
jgi:two-component system sensor histidine kinase/response regulator